MVLALVFIKVVERWLKLMCGMQCQSSLLPKYLPKFFTASYLVLIPKVDSLIGFDKFRPISLYSVFYTLCSKIIVNRLTSLLP